MVHVTLSCEKDLVERCSAEHCCCPGGNLAAAVSILSRDRQGPKLVFQLVFYPVIESPNGAKYPSVLEFGPGGLLTAQDVMWLVDQ